MNILKFKKRLPENRSLQKVLDNKGKKLAYN